MIPVYKNRELFLKNLAHNYPFLQKHEVIIIDDAYDPKLEKIIHERYPSIIYLKNDVNLGFAGTVNKGVKKAQGEYIFLLNSDVKLLDAHFEKAVVSLQKDKRLFAVSFMQKEKNGELVGKNTIFFRRGFLFHRKVKDTRPDINGWAEGGASIVRKQYFDELDGFDTLYAPFYWEDIDLSYRAYKRGWRVLFDPGILVEHHHESTIGKYFDKRRVKTIAFRNQLIFMWKNIADGDLFLSHLFFLPFHMVYCASKKEWEFFLGLWKALFYIPSVWQKRRSGVDNNMFSDREVLRIFTHTS